MKKYIISIFYLGCTINVFAEEKDIIFFKNESLDSCYRKPMSPAVQNCMIYLSGQKKREYEKQFKVLLKKAENVKGEFHNYSLFLKSLYLAKSKWDEYIEGECMAQAYLDENESFAFHIDKNVCLINGFNERIIYYKNYQF